MKKTYICIDLKSFYASVECVERGLDPLNTNLVVADNSRTEKTVCLAVTPSLKKYGIKGRARLFEVIKKVKDINRDRRKYIKYNFSGKSIYESELNNNKNLEVDYIIAPPQMKKYMKYSSEIYNIYLRYVAPEDIYVYSIDEVFMDITSYLKTYNTTPEKLVAKIIQSVYDETKITATSGIGDNLFLCKVAMDIVAKHKKPNEIGVRIAYLDEMSYKKELWNHTPITDFWRVGKGYAKKLEEYNMYTMGDIARCSLNNEKLLYKIFGVNAETLIDHAWGYEPCTLKNIKDYRPATTSICRGQVLHTPYNYKDASLIIREMMDLLSLELVDKKKCTNQITLTIDYDIDNLNNEYIGPLMKDKYNRVVPKHSHGTNTFEYYTSSTETLIKYVVILYEKIVNKDLMVRKISMSVNNLIAEILVKDKVKTKQLDLFSDAKNLELEKNKEQKEKQMQITLLKIKNKYGKNAILKGYNFEKKATTIERNNEVGGHRG